MLPLLSRTKPSLLVVPGVICFNLLRMVFPVRTILQTHFGLLSFQGLQFKRVARDPKIDKHVAEIGILTPGKVTITASNKEILQECVSAG